MINKNLVPDIQQSHIKDAHHTTPMRIPLLGAPGVLPDVTE